ncbi:MAG: hypothetical protein HY675_24040 [Chloroflexi bacterium]|nr:hypothetical protein [Chloroflexota bacterium]
MLKRTDQSTGRHTMMFLLGAVALALAIVAAGCSTSGNPGISPVSLIPPDGGSSNSVTMYAPKG